MPTLAANILAWTMGIEFCIAMLAYIRARDARINANL